MKKGFITILLLVGIAIALALGAYAYGKFQNSAPTPGAVTYTTQLSDTINTFRNEVNSSTANLNTELETVSGTVNGLGNLSTFNSPLPVANGGTGTTTAPANAQFLSASGTQPAWKTFIFGGGLLSTTTATSVQLNTAGFDPTQSISFTGNNSFAGTSTFNGNTIINGTTTAPYLAPVGVIEAYVTSTAPNGWLLCNGQTVATSSYPALFALIGYTYGGSTSTFGMPNLGGRFIAGPSSTLSTTLGATGGATSTVSGPYTLAPGAPGLFGDANPQTDLAASTNSSTLPTIPPYIIEQYIIKF